MRFGEDIDFSIRIFKAGKRCRLFPKAWVWHKRRTDFRKFWRQVYNSGIARINLYKKYPDSLKTCPFATNGIYCWNRTSALTHPHLVSFSCASLQQRTSDVAPF